MVYLYNWANNPTRAALKGRYCRIIASVRLGTVLIEMLDTAERLTTSRRALRKVQD